MATAKEHLRQWIEEIDETEAERVLALIAPNEAEELTMDDGDDGLRGLAETKPTTLDDPLWNIVGMFDPGPDAPTDVARNKHHYLADAYADRHEE